MKILVDHNIEGHATRLWDTLMITGWVELLSIEMFMFADVGLTVESSDRIIWQFAQEHQMFLWFFELFCGERSAELALPLTKQALYSFFMA